MNYWVSPPITGFDDDDKCWMVFYHAGIHTPSYSYWIVPGTYVEEVK